MRAKHVPDYMKRVPRRELSGWHVKELKKLGLKPKAIPQYLYKYPLHIFVEKVKKIMPQVREKEKLWEKMKKEKENAQKKKPKKMTVKSKKSKRKKR